MAEGQVLVDKTSMNLLIMQFDGLKRENETLRVNLEEALITQEHASQNLQTVTEALHKVQHELATSENHIKVQTDLLSLKDMQLHLAKKGFLDLYNQMRERDIYLDIDMSYAYPSLRPSESLAFSKEEIAQMNHECEQIRAELSTFSTAKTISSSQGMHKTTVIATTPRASTIKVSRSGITPDDSHEEFLHQTRHELATLKAERDALQKDNRELMLHVRKLMAETSSQRNILTSSQANTISRDEYLLEKHKLEKIISELHNGLDSTRQNADMLQQALDQEKERSLRLQEEKNTLSQQFFQAHEELEQLKVQFMTKSRHFDKSSADFETHARTLEEDNQKLAEHITQLTTDYQSILQQLTVKEEAISLLENDKKSLTEQISSLTQDIETLGAEFQAREQELDVATASLEQLLNKELYDAPIQTEVLANEGVIITMKEFREAKHEIRERGKQRIIHKVANIFNLTADKNDVSMETSLRLTGSQNADLAASMLDSGMQNGTMTEDEFINRLMILKTDMVAKLGEHKGLQEGLHRAKIQVSELENVNAGLAHRTEMAEKTIVSLRADLEEAQTKVDLLQKQNNNSLHQLTVENNELAARLMELKQKDDTSRIHSQDIMNALEEKTINLDKAQQELNWNQIKIGQLERRVTELEDELTGRITGGLQADKHIDALKKAYETKIAELNAEIDQRDADMNRLLKEQMNRYAEQRAELEAVVRAPSSRSHNQGLLNELVNLQKMYEEANGERYKLLAEIRAKETEYDDLSSKQAYLIQERDRLQLLLDETARVTRTMKQDELDQHTQMVSDYERRLQEKDAVINDLLGKTSKLELERNSLVTDFSSVDTRLKATLATSSELAEQLAGYKARIDELETENRQYLTEITMQKARLSSVRTGDSEKDKIITTLQESIKNYEKELGAYQSEIESLKGLITTRTRFLEAANNELAGIKKKHDMDTDKFKATIKQLNSRISELDILLNNAHKDDALISVYRQKIKDLETALKTEKSASEAALRAYKAEQKQEFKELEDKMKQLSYTVEERDSLRKEKKFMLKEIQRMRDEKTKLIKDHEEAMLGLLRNADEETETDRDNLFSRERFDYYKSQARKYKDLYKRAFNVVEKMKNKEREMKNVIIKLEDKLFEMGFKRNEILIDTSNRDSYHANYSTNSINGESQSESQMKGSTQQGSRTNSRTKQRRSDASMDHSRTGTGKGESPIIPINLAYKPNSQK